jgi:secreted PhoX family phosphatase
LTALLAAALLAASASARAAATNFSSFTPLTSSVAAGSLPETAPFLFGNPAWTQLSIADRATQLALGQTNSGTWDMIDTNRTGPDAGRYLFTVFETNPTGIQRTDRWTGSTVTLWPQGSAGAAWFDGVRWTPFGTFITAEEDWGPQPHRYGRLFELTNPTTAGAGGGQVSHRNAVARVSHEGLAFDQYSNLYYVDELNGGSLYRYSSATPSVGSTYFAGGTNSVLRVGDGSAANATGSATWVSFTNLAGNGLPGSIVVTDPNGITSVDGRATTDLAAFKGTDYNRPEDLEIQTLANGTQILYMTTTDTHEVYSLNLTTQQMQVFVSRATLDAATGLPVGTALSNPDNLAIDAAGNIYIIEDQPGGSADIWFATDADRDGVAESIGRWATMSTLGAEPSGLYFDVFDPNVAFINVQHPASGVDRMIQITAVPEAETYAMMLVGIGLIGWQLRRKLRRSAQRRLLC